MFSSIADQSSVGGGALSQAHGSDLLARRGDRTHAPLQPFAGKALGQLFQYAQLWSRQVAQELGDWRLLGYHRGNLGLESSEAGIEPRHACPSAASASPIAVSTASSSSSVNSVSTARKRVLDRLEDVVIDLGQVALDLGLGLEPWARHRRLERGESAIKGAHGTGHHSAAQAAALAVPRVSRS
jgi:hypothetical protein